MIVNTPVPAIAPLLSLLRPSLYTARLSAQTHIPSLPRPPRQALLPPRPSLLPLHHAVSISAQLASLPPAAQKSSCNPARRINP